MKRALFLASFITCAVASVCESAKPKSPPAAEPVAPAVGDTHESDEPRVTEFQGDDLAVAIRTLARQAKLAVVVDPSVQGTITLRIENKTPKEALEIIATAEDVSMTKKNGVYYFKAKHPPKPEDAKRIDMLPTPESIESFVPFVTKIFDTLLEYEARPETARRIARAKKELYSALMAEGFTKEEAFQILLSEQGMSFWGMRK